MKNIIQKGVHLRSSYTNQQNDPKTKLQQLGETLNHNQISSDIRLKKKSTSERVDNQYQP
jgi:hypothetical protein